MSEGKTISRVAADIGTTPYAVAIDAGRHKLSADEPKALGGGGTAPGPFDLVLSGLAACTIITLSMYAARKQWPLQGAHVDITLTRDSDQLAVARIVTLKGEFTHEQRARFADIAERTPVTLALKPGMSIRTDFH